MTEKFDSIEAAFMTLANPEDPEWADAFRFLSEHPRTTQMMVETFQDTLQQMGVEPTGTDPATGEPSFRLSDVARAMGVPEEDLELPAGEAGKREGD